MQGLAWQQPTSTPDVEQVIPWPEGKRLKDGAAGEVVHIRAP